MSTPKTTPAPGVKFDQERLLTVLLAPTVSEKATQIADKHAQVTFRVAPDATKPEVKAAVEMLFKVEVESVQIANVKGKPKRFGAYTGRRRNWKKAYVCLKPGQEINFAQEP
jgi:large subunit ribosomal protein L23